MNRSLPLCLIVAISFFFTGNAMGAQYGDLNCDDDVNIVDVQISILTLLGSPLDPAIDEDQSGIPDACDNNLVTDCGEGTLNDGGTCIIDPDYFQEALDGAYAEGLEEGSLLAGGYADGYDDALGLCEEIGGELGNCTNYNDVETLAGLDTESLTDIQNNCLVECVFAEDNFDCLTTCVATAAGLTVGCSTCWAGQTSCLIDNCLTPCLNIQSEACDSCQAEMGCDYPVELCTGLPEPPEPEPVGACENDNDLPLIGTDGFPEGANDCLAECVFEEDMVGCFSQCLQVSGLGSECAGCYAQYETCLVDNCLSSCFGGVTSESCLQCGYAEGCVDAVNACGYATEFTGVCQDLFFAWQNGCFDDPDCTQDVYSTMTIEESNLYIEWTECAVQYSGAEQTGDNSPWSDGQALLSYYYACSQKLTNCFDDEPFGGQNNCEGAVGCALLCGVDNAECLGQCAGQLGPDASETLSPLYQCALSFCTGESFTDECMLEMMSTDGPCAQQVDACFSNIPVGETCDYYFYECGSQCESEECFQSCAGALSEEASVQAQEFTECMEQGLESGGGWPNTETSLLFPYFVCAPESGPCLPPDTWGGDESCFNVFTCVTGCDFDDPECIEPCILQINDSIAADVSGLFSCLIDTCGTDNLTPACFIGSLSQCPEQAEACF